MPLAAAPPDQPGVDLQERRPLQVRRSGGGVLPVVAQRHREVVAGTGGDQPERGTRADADERGSHHPHHAVAAHGHDDLRTGLRGLAGELLRMLRPVGNDDLGADRRERVLDLRQDARGPTPARRGVDHDGHPGRHRLTGSAGRSRGGSLGCPPSGPVR